jgi:hypothetical protein
MSVLRKSAATSFAAVPGILIVAVSRRRWSRTVLPASPFHERHGRQVRIASQARGLAPWFAIAAIALAVLALLLAVR